MIAHLPGDIAGFVLAMHQGEGCWVVVLRLPRLQHRVMGRYRLRSDAEVHVCKLRRMLGDGYRVWVGFDG